MSVCQWRSIDSISQRLPSKIRYYLCTRWKLNFTLLCLSLCKRRIDFWDYWVFETKFFYGIQAAVTVFSVAGPCGTSLVTWRLQHCRCKVHWKTLCKVFYKNTNFMKVEVPRRHFWLSIVKNPRMHGAQLSITFPESAIFKTESQLFLRCNAMQLKYFNDMQSFRQALIRK